MRGTYSTCRVDHNQTQGVHSFETLRGAPNTTHCHLFTVLSLDTIHYKPPMYIEYSVAPARFIFSLFHFLLPVYLLVLQCSNMMGSGVGSVSPPLNEASLYLIKWQVLQSLKIDIYTALSETVVSHTHTPCRGLGIVCCFIVTQCSVTI